MSAVFNKVEDLGFVYPVFKVEPNAHGVAPGWYFYDEELAEARERDGDYDSSLTGPYPTRDACAKAAHATYALYQTL